ncbi:hypothetical protein LWI29_010037 [Acer saccharum]|uniref:C2H2-type domain-containing protein n=1 Tax=Acer saccharum TaxID=4024 RepID=A0AA39VYX1_ACESA|nr:hypothetical protein LWI29_010037 [Acer saccharum]
MLKDANLAIQAYLGLAAPLLVVALSTPNRDHSNGSVLLDTRSGTTTLQEMRDGYAEVVDPKSGVVGGVQDDYGEDTATEDQPVTPRAVSVASSDEACNFRRLGIFHFILLINHWIKPKRKQCNRGVPEKKAESKSMSSTGAYNTSNNLIREMEIIKGELMNVQENHFRNEVEDGNDSSIYTIFHEFLGSPRIKQHLLGNGMDLCLKPRRFELQDEVCCYKCSQCFVLETNTLWFWKHLAHGCNVQNTGGALSVLVLFLLRSFILPKGNVTSLGVSSQSNAAAGEDSNEVEDVGLL